MKETKGQMLAKVIWWIVFLMIVMWSLRFLIEGNTQKALMGLFTIITLVSLGLWQLKSRYSFPPYFTSMVYSFIFLSVGIGTFLGGYQIQYFDDMLHFLSGFWVVYGAFIILSLFFKNDLEQIPKRFIMIYLLSFSLAVAGFWEIVEFLGDRIFGFTAGRGYEDTMMDMIDGLLGGLVMTAFIVENHGKKK